MDERASCDICDQGTSLKEGASCVQCKQFMCNSCVEIHKKFNTIKSHEVLKLDGMTTHKPGISELNDRGTIKLQNSPSTETKSESSDIKPTSKHLQSHNSSLLRCSLHNQHIEFYCTKDQAPVCKTCKLIEHRKCPQFTLLNEAATKEEEDIRDTLEGIKVIENELFKVKKAKEFANENLLLKKQQILDQLKQLREKLDVLENNTVNELEQVYENNAAEQVKDTDTISETQELIQQLRSRIECINNLGSSEEKFVAAKTAERELKKYCEILEETSIITLTDIHFSPHPFWQQVEDLGVIGVEKISQQISLSKIVSYGIPLKVESDAEEVFIASMEVLSDGRKILLDIINNKLKLFSADNRFLSELSFPGKVHDMALLNDSVAMVTIPSKEEKSLQKVNIVDNGLQLECCIYVLNTKSALVAKNTDKSLLTVSYKDGKVYLIVADKNGCVQKASTSPTGVKRLIKRPSTAEMSADRETVYILDIYNGCLALDQSGTKIFHYKDTEYDFYGGLAVGDDKCVYLECVRIDKDAKQANILQLSPEGKMIRKLFRHDISPRVIPLKIVGNKMFVFTRNADNCMVLGCLYYKLM